MPVLIKIILVSTDDDGNTVEKARGYLYPGYEKTLEGIQKDVQKFAEELREKYGYVGV